MEDGRDSSLLDLIGESIRAALMDTHTALPGRIVEYDATTQTATVSADLQRELEDGDRVRSTVSVPEILEVPVLFPRAGGFSITFPVAIGDKCLLVFAERDISGWIQLGEEGVPPEARKHSYSDAVAILGLWPSTNPITPAPSTTALQIRSDDGATSIDVSADGVAVTTDGTDGATIDASAGPFTVDANGAITLTRGVNELLAVISAALDLIATSTVGGSPLSNAAAITAQKALIDVIRT